jgi:dipeptidyl aminopeptidase/acylaminoacyl peptidase
LNRTGASIIALAVLAAHASGQGSAFTLGQVTSYPFPNELTAAASGGRIAWALNEQGRRNIWVADAPDYKARQLTHYDVDDGQELTSVQISADGRYVVYVRGGDHGGNWDVSAPVNPIQSPTPFKTQVWSVAFDGGEPKALAEADDPAVSPRGDRVAFVKDRQIWLAPIDGASPAKKFVTMKGDLGDPVWSPDGSRLAFTDNRADHQLIGVYSNDSTPVLWVSPSTSRDSYPRWSRDGMRIAFERTPGRGGFADSLLLDRPRPWEIWTADARTGTAQLLWRSPNTLRGSYPSTQGGANLDWAAGDRVVFLSEMDGWPHLYSIALVGGPPTLLTPGNYMAEYIRLSGDGRWLVFAANAGTGADDIDRRHIVKAATDRMNITVMTQGLGLEWTPVVTGDAARIAFISATAQRPPLPAVMPVEGGSPVWIGQDRIPANFPTAQLVVPKKVVFHSSDGLEIHGQMFDADRVAAGGKKPAIVYVHGGPPRQMLLGWHYSDYYSNAYALNQYLASLGYVVLSVNYRLGIGYGRDFQHPRHSGESGASEYLDVKAAANYLKSLPQVDGKRIGIYGGSYGGFLTAMALARNSDLFAAGADIHGVHDWTAERAQGFLTRNRYEQPADADSAFALAFHSSPVSFMRTWKSPVILIHADDDRNVRFSQTVDLARRLSALGVEHEELVIPDDTHHMMRHANWIRVDSAAADFLGRKLGVH